MKRYERHGLLAIDPRALAAPVGELAPDRSNLRVGKACIVRVCGPIDHHSQPGCSLDSYDEIRARFAEACASDAGIVVLKVDSPGGMVAGCFELARDLRVKAAAAGKRLVAYVDGHACSAAYALASAALEIVIPESGVAGSIGIIDARVDTTALDAAMGLRFAVITSGERKADGNPHVALSDAELEERQSLVNALASVFFALVSDHRKKPAAVFAGLQARQLNGTAAVKAGLADRVQTFDEMLASFEGAGVTTMATKFEDAKAALAEAAKGDGEDAERARKALAAMEEDDETSSEGDDAPSDEEDDETSSEGDDAPSDDEKKKKEQAAAAVSAETAGALAAQVATLSAEVTALKATNGRDAVKAFLAARKDLPQALVTTLSTKPLAEVKAIVNAIPKPKTPKPAATATVPSTRGTGQGEPAPAGGSADPELARIDRMMGVAKTPSAKAELKGNTLYLGRAPESDG
jgi:ClpP class serine protease